MTTAVIELVVVMAVLLMNAESILDAVMHWRSDGLMLLPFCGLLIFPLGMSGLVLWVKSREESESSGAFCRVCGYDLRASKERCPECGTPIRVDADRF